MISERLSTLHNLKLKYEAQGKKLAAKACELAILEEVQRLRNEIKAWTH